MSSRSTFRSQGALRRTLLPAAVAVMALLALAWSGSAQAQSYHCWLGGASMSFGTVSPGGATGTTTFNFTCQNYTGGTVTYLLCPFVDPNAGIPPGVAPRYMTNWGPGPYLRFDLYTNPAFSDLIGSLESGHVPMGQALTIAANSQQPSTMTFYGRIPPGQNVAAGSYYSQNSLRLKYAVRSGTTAPTKEECAQGTPTESNYFPLDASFANTCAISTASDLEFGDVASLAQDRTSTSEITLFCPIGTTWNLGLNNGAHAIGTTRNMAGPGGARIPYELHRQPTHNDRWGNSIGVDTVSGTGTGAAQTLTVYGKVASQPTTPAAGAYADTITVTLTF